MKKSLKSKAFAKQSGIFPLTQSNLNCILLYVKFLQGRYLVPVCCSVLCSFSCLYHTISSVQNDP